MPLYRDDLGGLYWSMSAGLTGERLRPGAIAMPESAWLRILRVKPGRERALTRLAMILSGLVIGLMLLGLAGWGLIGTAGLMLGLAPAALVALLVPALLMIPCERVAMDRPLRMVLPQPRALMLLEILAALGVVPALLLLALTVADGPYGMAFWALALVSCLVGVGRVAASLYRLRRATVARPVLG